MRAMAATIEPLIGRCRRDPRAGLVNSGDFWRNGISR